MNWSMTRHVSSRVMHAEAQRQYEEDVRACYTIWTAARDEALIMLKARLALTDACEDYERDAMAAKTESDNDLRELLLDQASDKRDNAEAVYEFVANVRR